MIFLLVAFCDMQVHSSAILNFALFIGLIIIIIRGSVGFAGGVGGVRPPPNEILTPPGFPEKNDWEGRLPTPPNEEIPQSNSNCPL